MNRQRCLVECKGNGTADDSLPGSKPALFMRIKSAFWYSKCAFNAHKKRWCGTWAACEAL